MISPAPPGIPYNPPRMRRWLLILLLVLLPIQSVWAEAAAYCQHEGRHENPRQIQSADGGTSSHWGHHEHAHQHSDAAQALADDPSSPLASVDVDCNVCHAGGAVPFPAWQRAPSVSWVSALQPHRTPALPTRALAPPDKPNWAAAA